MTTDNHALFWSRLEAVNAGMLSAGSKARPVPMSHQIGSDDASLWFITAQGTDLVKAAQNGPVDAEYVIASGSDGLYTHIEGQLSLNTDKAKLDELWNAVASSWFEDGKQDPDVRLLQLRLKKAEVWATSTSGLKFLYEIAKARVTGAKPDMGEHFSLAFV